MIRVVVIGGERIVATVNGMTGPALANRLRRGVRAGAKPFQAALREVAASSDVPRSFRKVPAAKVSTRGGASGRDIVARVRPKSPLFNIYEPGAGRHTIVPGEKGFNASRPSRPTGTAARSTGRRALAGRAGGSVWPLVHSDAGRDRLVDFFSTGPVDHPGMDARPLLPRAFGMARGAALDAFAAVVFDQPRARQ